MNFEAIVGNPPYRQPQDKFSRVVYHIFVESAYALADHVVLIHPAQCLSNVGYTPREFNRRLLESPHLRVALFEPNSRKLFTNLRVDGGLVITDFDCNNFFEPIGEFNPDPDRRARAERIKLRADFQPLSAIVFNRSLYRLSEKFYFEQPEAWSRLSANNRAALTTNIFELLPEFFLDNPPPDHYEYVRVYGRHQGASTSKFFRRDYLCFASNIDKYKVFVRRPFDEPIVGEPMSAATQSYLSIGAFESQSEAMALRKYLRTPFVRGLISTTRSERFNDVPLQDFTARSDLNWRASLDALDSQLHKKYDLDGDRFDRIT